MTRPFSSLCDYAEKEVTGELESASKRACRIHCELIELRRRKVVRRKGKNINDDLSGARDQLNELKKSQDKCFCFRLFNATDNLTRAQAISESLRQVDRTVDVLWGIALTHGLDREEYRKIRSKIDEWGKELRGRLSTPGRNFDAFVNIHVSMEVDNAREHIQQQLTDVNTGLQTQLRRNRELLGTVLKNTAAKRCSPKAKRLCAKRHELGSGVRRNRKEVVRQYREGVQCGGKCAQRKGFH